jgi:hypothetical protein
MRPSQLNSPQGSLMPGLTMQKAVGRVYVRVTSLTLVAYCSVQRRMSNAKIHGVHTGSSGQDPKADHGTAIGSRETSDPDALSLGTRRLVAAPGGSRCLRTRSCANAARRALRWCSPSRSGRPRRRHARPVAADRSHPRWRSLPQRPHERAEDHGRYTLTPHPTPAHGLA